METTLEKRLERLEEAHRALAAQHLALQTTCRVTLPLISAAPGVIRRLLLMAYDIANEQMAQAQHDEAFQADVRQWLDVLAETIVAGEGIADGYQNSDEGDQRGGS